MYGNILRTQEISKIFRNSKNKMGLSDSPNLEIFPAFALIAAKSKLAREE
jgi:hypothetical protein